MGASDLLFITISRNVSFVGKAWCMMMLVLRLLVLLLAGFTLFSDEQERFICNTIQPGCSKFYGDRSREVSSFSHENSSSSREVSLHKTPLHKLQREWGAPRFYCAYFLVVILRILVEVVFGAGQFFLFGFSIPRSFLCYEAPCTSGVECYISRPTEKTLMLNLMLAVASSSILLSVVDLVSSMKAMVRWRIQREMLMEEMSKGEETSMFTMTATTEDSDVPLTRTISPSESSKKGLKDQKAVVPLPDGDPLHARGNNGTVTKTGEVTNDTRPGCKDAKLEMSRSAAPMSTPVPTHFVFHSHMRPPMSPRTDRGPPKPGMPTPMGAKKLDQNTPVGANSGQHSDSSESKEKRAWV
ncbi:gap junction delta-4 protein-like [Etheostoma cragini]|uniref:gap junction delta-4 protein-like n=1 Tax=Etheostoma cragini TaxID=417921 RepID=UPI00155F09B1|nr:gap junction delta-4 protein-like [Etheostoma cragini]